jgi:hypothetical protein
MELFQLEWTESSNHSEDELDELDLTGNVALCQPSNRTCPFYGSCALLRYVGLSVLRRRLRRTNPICKCLWAGLVELHKYSESFGPLDEAIRLSKKGPVCHNPASR